MCKTALEQDGGPGLVQGFYMSMLLLVSLPILMVGTFLYLLRKAAAKAGPGTGTGPTAATSSSSSGP
jgi:hypothetical protein